MGRHLESHEVTETDHDACPITHLPTEFYLIV